MSTLNSKIVVVGAGKVGSTTAYTLMLSHLASEIVLIDVNKDRAQGEALDISHGIAYLWQTIVRAGDYEDCADADIIIITAGIGRQPGQSRLDLTRTNVSIIRLRYLLSDHCKVDVRSIHAFIVGEHGDSELPLWSHASLASKPFNEYCDKCAHPCGGVNRQKMFEATRDAGIEIIEKKGATFYGVSLAAARIAAAIMGNENAVLTLSSVLNGDYGISGAALSLPCIVNRGGIDRFLDLQITEEEKSLLLASAEKLKSVIREVYQ